MAAKMLFGIQLKPRKQLLRHSIRIRILPSTQTSTTPPPDTYSCGLRWFRTRCSRTVARHRPTPSLWRLRGDRSSPFWIAFTSLDSAANSVVQKVLGPDVSVVRFRLLHELNGEDDRSSFEKAACHAVHPVHHLAIRAEDYGICKVSLVDQFDVAHQHPHRRWC